MTVDARTALAPRAEPADELLGGLDRTEWDRLAGSNFYSSAGWLAFCAADFGSPSRVALARRAGRPVAAVPYCALTDRTVDSYRWSRVLAGLTLPSPPESGLLVGPREGYQSHLLGEPGHAGELVAQLRAATPADQACVAMYVTTEQAQALRQETDAPVPVLLDADAWIAIPDGGWSAWTASFTGHRRRIIQAEARKFGDAGYLVEEMPLAECCELLGPLATATLAKHGHQSDSETELRSLRHHHERLGDAARTLLLWLDGQLVGFCLYYRWADTVFLRWAGFDYDRLIGVGEYFNLVYYAQLTRAAEHGTRWLHAGVSAAAAKALRGAELRPVWLVDLTPDSVLHPAEDRIRKHNQAATDRFRSDLRTAASLTAEWSVTW